MFLGNRSDSTTAASETSHRLPRLWPFLLVLASAAICLDLSTIHQYHASDSLLPVLVSLQHWTPFFWLQDRVGMLVPLCGDPSPPSARQPLGSGRRLHFLGADRIPVAGAVRPPQPGLRAGRHRQRVRVRGSGAAGLVFQSFHQHLLWRVAGTGPCRPGAARPSGPPHLDKAYQRLDSASAGSLGLHGNRPACSGRWSFVVLFSAAIGDRQSALGQTRSRDSRRPIAGSRNSGPLPRCSSWLGRSL